MREGLAAWAKQQRKWLGSHPPEACYKDMHQRSRKGVVQVRKLAAGIDNLIGVDLEAAGEACAQAR